VQPVIKNDTIVYQTINEILRGRRAVTTVMALKLSRSFNNSPEFWLNAQCAVDLWEAEQHCKEDIKRISPLQAA